MYGYIYIIYIYIYLLYIYIYSIHVYTKTHHLQWNSPTHPFAKWFCKQVGNLSFVTLERIHHCFHHTFHLATNLSGSQRQGFHSWFWGHHSFGDAQNHWGLRASWCHDAWPFSLDFKRTLYLNSLKLNLFFDWLTYVPRVWQTLMESWCIK